MIEPAVEGVLSDFRAWLQQVAAASSASFQGLLAAGPGTEEPIDLHTLLGQFLALRHEVNLQTRAVRAQQEQNAETLRQLSQAVQAVRQATPAAEPAAPTSAEDPARPLLKSLVELYDALAPAEREVQRVARAIGPELDRLAELVNPPPGPSPSLWARLFGGRRTPAADEAEHRHQARQALEHMRQVLGSLLTGYGMSLQRLERTLQQQGLEAIPTVGRPFDPERMEVVDVVTDSDRPAGEVVEELRRGYLWRGRVFRYALVRVAKP